MLVLTTDEVPQKPIAATTLGIRRKRADVIITEADPAASMLEIRGRSVPVSILLGGGDMGRR